MHSVMFVGCKRTAYHFDLEYCGDPLIDVMGLTGIGSGLWIFGRLLLLKFIVLSHSWSNVGFLPFLLLWWLGVISLTCGLVTLSDQSICTSCHVLTSSCSLEVCVDCFMLLLS